VKVVHKNVFYALDENNSEELFNACKDGKKSYCIGA
jgi:hypothetical protein